MVCDLRVVTKGHVIISRGLSASLYGSSRISCVIANCRHYYYYYYYHHHCYLNCRIFGVFLLYKLNTRYMFMSGDQNTALNHDGKINNQSLERFEQVRYLVTILKNQNCIQEEIKSTLKSQGMLAIIRCRIFCLSGCYPKI